MLCRWQLAFRQRRPDKTKDEDIMTNGYQPASASRTIAALVCAMLLSATCIMGAVAPAAMPTSPASATPASATPASVVA